MARSGLDVGAFEAVPVWVGRRLRQHVDRAADGLLAELRRGDPQIGEEEAGRARAGIAAGMRHFCDLVEDPGAGWERVAAFYLRVGRHLARDGRDPVETHQALRRSALVAWRTLGAVPGGLDLDRAALSLVVDAQFCYMDAVAEVLAAGYSAEVAERRDRREEPGRGGAARGCCGCSWQSRPPTRRGSRPSRRTRAGRCPRPSPPRPPGRGVRARRGRRSRSRTGCWPTSPRRSRA
ncbi:hypothetical protein ACFQY7_43315 [Actinomadura luteofluorescens]|uniref:hypothetical protein n=1 Tax=Actinomadura luteofluorescens TaxID=46163 RepID=UPI00362E124E